MTSAGFSHSEIPGSTPVCGSPRLIAASHVLHRLSAPRHPPCTLSSLTKVKNCTLETSTLRFARSAESMRPRRNASSESFTLGFNSVVKDRRPAQAAFAAERGQVIVAGTGGNPSRPVGEVSGGADRSRTDDLRLARAALSQLSYSPRPVGRFKRPTVGGPR